MKPSPLRVALALLIPSFLSTPLFSEEEDQPFTAQIECKYRCEGATGTRPVKFSQIFSPVKRGLRRGNGNYWGGLGWNLWSWGSEWCLEKAVHDCSRKNVLSEKSVAEFSLVTLSSAKWEVNEPIDCRRREKIALSPYGMGMLTLPGDGIMHSEAPRSTTLAAEPLPKKVTARSCRTEIKGTICFGDCLIPTSGKEFGGGDFGIETLASSEPNATESVSYCADTFVKNFSGRGLSVDVLSHYCNAYVWNAVMNTNKLTAACAATRISTDCEKLANDIVTNGLTKTP